MSQEVFQVAHCLAAVKLKLLHIRETFMCDLKNINRFSLYIHFIERINFKYKCNERFNDKNLFLIYRQIYERFTKIRLPTSTYSVNASHSAVNSDYCFFNFSWFVSMFHLPFLFSYQSRFISFIILFLEQKEKQLVYKNVYDRKKPGWGKSKCLCVFRF